MKNKNTVNGLPVKNTPPQGKFFGLFILIIAVVVIAAGIIYKIILSGPSDSMLAPDDKTEKVEGEALPDVFYSYRGIIKEIKPGEIIMEVKADNYFLNKDIQVRVVVNEATRFVKKTIPSKLGEISEEESADLLKQEDITLDDLSVGDKILAVTGENVRGKTEFVAQRIDMEVIE